MSIDFTAEAQRAAMGWVARLLATIGAGAMSAALAFNRRAAPPDAKGYVLQWQPTSAVNKWGTVVVLQMADSGLIMSRYLDKRTWTQDDAGAEQARQDIRASLVGMPSDYAPPFNVGWF